MPNRMNSEKIINLMRSDETEHLNLDALCRQIEPQVPDYRIGLLPDAHIKDKLETPSSAVIATQQKFSLHLTSPSPNCGISLLKTPFSKQELDSGPFLNRFIDTFKKEIPLAPEQKKLSQQTVLEILANGVAPLINLYEMDPEICQQIELQGNVFAGENITPEEIQPLIPEFIQRISQFRFGILGGGNHFLEFQEVDKIYDDSLAQCFGIEPNQALIMFHTGSEAIGSLIGRIYAHRQKTTLKMTLKMLPEKLKFHLKSLNPKNIMQQLNYFRPAHLAFNDPQTPDGLRVLRAYHAAFNFGYANRLYITRQIQRIFSNYFAQKNGVQLLFDVSHNSIFRELLGEREFYLQRHNSCRILPRAEYKDHPIFSTTGQPILLPGTNRHASFLCVAGDNLEKSLHTIDHGFGKLIMDQAAGQNPTGERGMTRLFQYQNDRVSKEPLLDESVSVREIEKLEKLGVLKRVARLSPFANLKGPKAKIN